MRATDADSRRSDIWVFDRRAGCMVREVVLGDRWLRAAYTPVLRPLCRWSLFRRPWASRLVGRFCDSRLSRRKIPRVIAQLGLDTDEFQDPVTSYRTFNEFFTRRLRPEVRPFDSTPAVFCSPADARLSAFAEWPDGNSVDVKSASYTIEELLGRSDAADAFSGGALLIARLCPADYHRFHYPATGSTRDAWEIPGGFESVNPTALATNPRVFVENRRIVNLLDLEMFGLTAFIEVGAFGVGSIVQTHSDGRFRKMDEKGFFKFGGSTIVLLFQAGRFVPDPDLIDRTRQGIETWVRAGERLGKAVVPSQ